MKRNNMKRILVACEESQTVTKAFRALGFEAYSCDTEPCSGGHPEWHLCRDVLEVVNDGWDLMIAHPPCTYLTITGNKWMKPEYADRFPDRPQQREDAVRFFLALYNAPIPKIAVENPAGVMSTRFRKPDQYVHPYHFGDPHSKRTGWWLKNLPLLEHTEVVAPDLHTFASGKRMSTWHFETGKLSLKDRSRVRSILFPGMVSAIVDQWGSTLTS